MYSPHWVGPRTILDRAAIALCGPRWSRVRPNVGCTQLLHVRGIGVAERDALVHPVAVLAIARADPPEPGDDGAEVPTEDGIGRRPVPAVVLGPAPPRLVQLPDGHLAARLADACLADERADGTGEV